MHPAHASHALLGFKPHTYATWLTCGGFLFNSVLIFNADVGVPDNLVEMEQMTTDGLLDAVRKR